LIDGWELWIEGDVEGKRERGNIYVIYSFDCGLAFGFMVFDVL